MSRLTRDDYKEMRRCQERPGVSLSVKLAEQHELDRQKEEYFAKGGKIHGISIAATGATEPKQWGNTQEKMDELKGTLGITEAAAYCHLSKKSLDAHISRKTGPEFQLIQGKRRFTAESLKTWIAKRREAA